MRLSFRLVALSTALAGLCCASQASILYVKANGNDSLSGGSWDLAKKTIAGAMAATSGGDQIWVAQGSYTNATITVKPGVSLYGGFAGAETSLAERPAGPSATLLQPGTTAPTFTFSSGCGPETVLDGFCLRPFGPATQTAFQCSGASPTISNNIVVHYAPASGGVILCQDSSAVISGNRIAGCTGTAIWCSGSGSARITGNRIVSNDATADGTGGAIRVEGCSPVITANVIGGDAVCAVRCLSGSPQIRNNTLAANATGLAVEGGSPAIDNNIIAANGTGVKVTEGEPIIRSNCVWDSDTADYSGVPDQTGLNGNISDDPQFADISYCNVHLQPLSPCVDAGDDLLLSPGDVQDVDGQARVQNGRVDMGADESDLTEQTAGPSGILYVQTKNANPAKEGSSWQLSMFHLPRAMDMAIALGRDVWVASGSYSLGQLRPFAHVYGGFTSSETSLAQRDWQHNPTTINLPDVTLTHSLEATRGQHVSSVDGLWFAQVVAKTPAVWVVGASPDIRNCSVQCTTANGIYCESSQASISGSLLRGNLPDYNNSGIYAKGCWLNITNSEFTGWYYGLCLESSYALVGGNRFVGNRSCGIYGNASSPVIVGNLITGNGYGIWTSGASPAIAYNQILGNDYGGVACSAGEVVGNNISGNGGSATCTDASTLVIGNTFLGNTGLIAQGSGYPSLMGTFIDNVIAFNGDSPLPMDGFLPRGHHNCIYANGSEAEHTGLIPLDGNNFSADPMLVCTEYGDIHLQPGSPCIDAGDDSVVRAAYTDIDGGLRIQGAHVDIGAVEFDGVARTAHSRVVRVSPDGDDENDGNTWATAMRTVSQAIVVAAATGGQVWVKAGTYTERPAILPFLAVYGGFAGCESNLAERNPRTHETVLNGGGSGSVITARGGFRTSRIDGFTIKGGNATNGGGVYSYPSSLTVSGCRITGNTAKLGGGVYIQNRGTVLSRCEVTGNTATQDGGGIAIVEPGASVAGCLIAGNSATMRGGGIVHTTAGATLLTNNTIESNRAADGGAVWLSGATLANSIATANTPGIYVDSTYPATLLHNCVFGNTSYNYTGISNPTGSDGNISVSPLFVNQTGGNYHLQPGSPCRGAGDSALTGGETVDLDGNPRIQGTAVDIGAYELPYAVVASIRDAKSAPDGSLVSMGAVVTARFMDGFYIEASGRQAGILVRQTGPKVSEGNAVSVQGTMQTTANGERCVQAEAVTVTGTGNIVPVVISNRNLGGGADGVLQAGVRGGMGLNTIGLLVSCQGTVTAVDPAGQYFVVWDGSGGCDGPALQDASGAAGVRIWAPGLQIPQTGEYVRVRGVCSCYKDGDSLLPRLLVRSQTDISKL